MRKQYDRETVKKTAAGRWREIVTTLAGIPAEILDGRHHPCPRCGGTDRFRALDDFAETGAVLCNQCHSKENGDGLATVQWATGTDFATAVNVVGAHVGAPAAEQNGSPRGKPARKGSGSPIDWHAVLASILSWQATDVGQAALTRLAGHLGVTVDSLHRLRVGRARGLSADFVALLFDGDGNPIGGQRRVIDPAGDKKILFPRDRGSRLGLFLPDGIEAAGSTLWVCEGMSDTAALLDLGLPAVGRAAAKGRETTAQLATFVQRAKPSLVVFVADQDGDAQGIEGARQAAATIHLAGTPAKIIDPPAGAKDARAAVHAGATREGIERLAEAADPITDEQADQWGGTRQRGRRSESDRPASHESDAATEADLFIDAHERTQDGTLRLRFWRDELHRWHNGGAYHAVPEGDMRAAIASHLDARYDRVTRNPIINILEMIRARTLVEHHIDQPSWLGRQPHGWPAERTIACRNGLVNLDLASQGRPDCLQPPTPAFFTSTALPYAFDPEAPQPEEWRRFLEILWPEDREAIAVLQQWFGYCLLPDTSQHKILLIVGPPRSGKGTILRIMQAVIGKENCCSPTLASLGTNFGLWNLIGKSLALIGDARLGGRADIQGVVERLLSISGEDTQSIDRKNLRPVNTTLSTRFVIVSNELPRLGDSSGAVASRMIILRLTESFYGREDTHLLGRLLPELPSILNWAIAGRAHLEELGRFAEPASSAEMREDLEDLGSPVMHFVRDRCVVQPGVNITVKDLYKAYCEWCESQGRVRVEDQTGFGRNLRAALPRVVKRRHLVLGTQVTHYDGIGLQAGEPW